MQYDSQSTDANGVTRRLRETDQSSISSANGNVSIVGVQSVDLDASNVAALNGTLRIHSEGTVNLGFNTDVEQKNWTTVDVRRSWYGKKTVTTTEHEVTDKTAVVTDLQVSCPSVRNSFFAEFQPLFFQRSACRGWFLMGLLRLLVLRCASSLRKTRQARRHCPWPMRTVLLELV